MGGQLHAPATSTRIKETWYPLNATMDGPKGPMSQSPPPYRCKIRAGYRTLLVRLHHMLKADDCTMWKKQSVAQSGCRKTFCWIHIIWSEKGPAQGGSPVSWYIIHEKTTNMGIKGEKRHPRRRRYKRRAEITQVTTSFHQTLAIATADKSDTSAVTEEASWLPVLLDARTCRIVEFISDSKKSLPSFSRQNIPYTASATVS